MQTGCYVAQSIIKKLRITSKLQKLASWTIIVIKILRGEATQGEGHNELPRN